MPGGAEQEHDLGDRRVERVVPQRRGLLQHAPRVARLSGERQERDRDQGRHHAHRGQPERDDLGPPAAPDAVCRPQGVRQERHQRVAPTQARAVVVAIAEVVDAPGGGLAATPACR